MLGATVTDLRAEGLLPAVGDGADLPDGAPVSVKEAVMPFNRFRLPDGRSVDTVLGPEMRSTGEVMGVDELFGTAFAKSQTAAYGGLPAGGRVFVSLANRDKRHMVFPVKRLADLGFEIIATAGTAHVLRRNGVAAGWSQALLGWRHRRGPTITGRILAGDVDLIINTPTGTTPGRQPASRRLRDPDRGGTGKHPVHHDRAGAGRRPGHRGGPRRRHRGPVPVLGRHPQRPPQPVDHGEPGGIRAPAPDPTPP